MKTSKKWTKTKKKYKELGMKSKNWRKKKNKNKIQKGEKSAKKCHARNGKRKSMQNRWKLGTGNRNREEKTLKLNGKWELLFLAWRSHAPTCYKQL